MADLNHAFAIAGTDLATRRAICMTISSFKVFSASKDHTTRMEPDPGSKKPNLPAMQASQAVLR